MANKASGSPTSVSIPQPGMVFLGIANHEAANVNYAVRVDLVGVRIVHNATARTNETVDLNCTTLSGSNVMLADSLNWTHPYTFSTAFAGLWNVQFLLFKYAYLANVYHGLHLYVTAT